jgi:protein phosphatase 1G
MEDSHIANLDIGDGVSIFGVFDGHGGKSITMLKFHIGAEVAHFVKKYFIKELKKLESFKKKDYRAALTDCFLKMDSLMLSKEGKKEI